MNQIYPDYSLYLVTDRELLMGKSLETTIEEAIQGGVTIVQLREKNVSTREFYDIAVRIKNLLTSYHVPLIINDRLDIALAVDAEGLHIGQDDLPATLARSILGPNKILGVSASTHEEALKAQADGADYLGVGAMFPTNTKTDANTVTVETLTQICQSVAIPVVAIGGINSGNIHQLRRTGIAGVAVVSAIISHTSPRDASVSIYNQIQLLK